MRGTNAWGSFSDSTINITVNVVYNCYLATPVFASNDYEPSVNESHWKVQSGVKTLFIEM